VAALRPPGEGHSRRLTGVVQRFSFDALLRLSLLPHLLMHDVAPALAPSAVSAAPDAAPPARPEACATCGALHHGDFCNGCGQRAVRGRFTVRTIVAHLVTDAFDLNRGLLFTAVALFRRPGEVVREYVSGATVRYTNPVKYLVVCVALVVFATIQLGATGEVAGGFAEGFGTEAAVEAQRVTELLNRYMNVLMALAVPFMAAASRLLFRRARLNYAEHLIFNLYVYAQQSLLFLPFVPLWGLRLPAFKLLLLLAYCLAMLVYYAWAATSFFGERTVPGVLRALATQAMGGIAYAAVAALAVAALVAAGGG